MKPYRERRSLALVESTAQDIRYAVRTLCKSPVYTATAVALLALAIGANTAMFSVLNAVLLRPLPYLSPDRLVMLWSEIPGQSVREGRTAYWNIDQWRSQNRSFTDLAFFDGVSVTLTSPDKAEQISAARTSPNLFALLGVPPLHGRIFSDEEAQQRQRLAVISYRFWQIRFGASSDAIGATITLDGTLFQVVGILPKDFQWDTADVWEPYTMYPDWEVVRSERGSGFWAVIGRLKPKVTVKQAQAEMSVIARRVGEQSPPADWNRGIRVTPLSLQVVGARPRLALLMLTGAVFFVLLIAATNVAGISLARSASRQREIAIRVALGASRARIVRQLLAEGLTLAVAAGLMGLLLAAGGMRLILTAKPGNLPRLNEVNLGPYVLGGALALCLLTGILVGLVPAIAVAKRRDLSPSGQEGGRGIAGGVATVRTRRILVVTEFGLAMILLFAAGLLVRSLWSVERVNLGFSPERVLSLSLAPPASTATAQRAGFYKRVLEQVRSLPAVESAGIASEVFIGSGSPVFVTEEGGVRAVSDRLQLRSDELSEGLFNTIKTPLISGRLFSDTDGLNLQHVAIINEVMAGNLWSGRDPVGRRFKLGGPDAAQPWFTVVGVVGNMRRQGLEEDPIPQMFEPLAQNPPRRAILLVRTSVDDTLSMAGAVQAAVRAVEKQAPVYAVTTMENQLGAFLTQRRFETSLLTGFSVVALLMAAIGIYGLIQYSVATRTHEIGIRMAVGAQTRDVFRMIMAEGLKLALAGLVLGLAGSLCLGRTLSRLLFGVTAADPWTLLAVSVLLTAIALVACYLPARHATKVQPMAALRQE